MRPLLIALTAVLLTAQPAAAIVGGEADAGRHPAVGLLAREVDGQHFTVCSGWYAGPYRHDHDLGVYVTAGHCVDGYDTEQLRVTFDEHVEQSEEGFPDLPVSAGTWHPALFSAHAPDSDHGVVLLPALAGIDPITLPAAHRMNALAAGGSLKPRTVFDNVGYGVNAIDEGVRGHEFLFNDVRSSSESKYLGLTRTTVQLLANEDAGYGGVCYFDSGGPVLEHGTQDAVALIAGRGDGTCRAKFDAPRVDTAAARAFFGAYLDLP